VFSFTLAYQLDSSGFISLIGYMRIIYAYIVDLVFFHAVITPISSVAASVILIVAVSLSVYKLCQEKSSKPKLVELSDRKDQ